VVTPVHPVQQDHSGSIRTKHRTKRPRPPPSSFITHLAFRRDRNSADRRPPISECPQRRPVRCGLRPTRASPMAWKNRPHLQTTESYGREIPRRQPPAPRSTSNNPRRHHTRTNHSPRARRFGSPIAQRQISAAHQPDRRMPCRCRSASHRSNRLSRFPAASGADRRHASDVPLRPWDRPAPATFIAPQRNRSARVPRPHRIGLDLLLRFLHNVHPKLTGTPSEPTGGSEPTASNLLTPSGLLRYRASPHAGSQGRAGRGSSVSRNRQRREPSRGAVRGTH
jgi:hypothetical protein